MTDQLTPRILKCSTFTKIDGYEFPQLKTPNYLVDLIGLKDITQQIESSICFGELLPGRLGKHNVRFNDEVPYGGSIPIPFLTNFRDAKDEYGTSLSTYYIFEKGKVTINAFLLVKNPWANLIKTNRETCIVQGAVRCLDGEYLPRVQSELQKIISAFAKK